VVKSPWLRIQSVNHVFALTLTLHLQPATQLHIVNVDKLEAGCLEAFHHEL
jgi:hypothetical protein